MLNLCHLELLWELTSFRPLNCTPHSAHANLGVDAVPAPPAVAAVAAADDDGAELPAGFLPRPGASVSTSVREDNGGTAVAVAAALLLLLLLQSADAVTPPLPLPLPVPAPAPAPGSAPAPSVSAAAATSPVTSSVGGVVADGSHSPSATRPSREGQHRARFTGPRQKRHRVLNAADRTRVRADCAGKRHL